MSVNVEILTATRGEACHLTRRAARTFVCPVLVESDGLSPQVGERCASGVLEGRVSPRIRLARDEKLVSANDWTQTVHLLVHSMDVLELQRVPGSCLSTLEWAW